MDEINPFTPGSGEPPPLRVGHAFTTDFLDMALKRIRAGRHGTIAILYGPRGNGKTSLQAETQARAAKSGIKVVEFGKVAEAADGEGAWELTGPDAPGEETTTRSVQAGFSALKGSHTTTKSAPSEFDEAIRSLVENSPVLLLVDEAHSLPRSLGSGLLHSIQRFIKGQKPLFALLAGTPGILDHLRKLDASFIERATRLPVGRIESERDVLDALAVPAEASGLPMDQDALGLLAAESQRYPYFLQLLGYLAWQVAHSRGHSRITLGDAKECLKLANERREEFYLARYEELMHIKLAKEAALVSKAMVAKGDEPRLSRKEMAEALSQDTPLDNESVFEITRKLMSVGLIWRSTGGTWEPGIPSLCAYVCEQSA